MRFTHVVTYQTGVYKQWKNFQYNGRFVDIHLQSENTQGSIVYILEILQQLLLFYFVNIIGTLYERVTKQISCLISNTRSESDRFSTNVCKCVSHSAK